MQKQTRRFLFICALFCSAGTTKAQTAESLLRTFLQDPVIAHAHAGVCIYSVDSDKNVLSYDADKYFIPSSNVKLFTLYAGLRYLGDSLPGLRYSFGADSTLYIQPTGDPTFLLAEFPDQPVLDFLKRSAGRIILDTSRGTPDAFAPGWVIDDMQEDYFVPRAAFPAFGNTAAFSRRGAETIATPSLFSTPAFLRETGTGNRIASVRRAKLYGNNFLIADSTIGSREATACFFSDPIIAELLADTLHRPVAVADGGKRTWNVLRSQSTDSLFRRMMFRSDNFFAEQTLLMAGNEQTGCFSQPVFIKYLLQNDLRDLPDAPRWVDGSGLSRYDLFSPRDFVFILKKTVHDFGRTRLYNILPSGGKGTLKGRYEKAGEHIHAKTGSMSNNFSLAGLLDTEHHGTLVFSLLVNNYIGNGTQVREAFETLLEGLRTRQ